jgi:hypothetical protein
MSNEQIYLYRRKGLSDYATCDRARYVELSQHKLFETMVCYASADHCEDALHMVAPVVERQPVDAILLENCEEVTVQDYGRGYFATDDCVAQLYTAPPELAELQATIAKQAAEIERIKKISDNYCALGMDANQEVFQLRAQLADAAQSLETISLQAGRDEFMKDMTQIRGYANSRARVAQGGLSAGAEHAPVSAVMPERLTSAELEELEVIEVLLHGQGLSNLAGTMAAARQFIDEVASLDKPANKERAQ